jgi:hypothetical protein
MEEAKEADEVEEVEDDRGVAGASRLARKLASFGMAFGRHYTLGRMDSEASKIVETLAIAFISTWLGARFILISRFCHVLFIFAHYLRLSSS